MNPQSELCPTNEKARDLFNPNHRPLGECTVEVEIPAVAINYDEIVEDIEENLLIDTSMRNHAKFNSNMTCKN